MAKNKRWEGAVFYIYIPLSKPSRCHGGRAAQEIVSHLQRSPGQICRGQELVIQYCRFSRSMM